MTKPKPEKADQDNNRKVIAFTIHPELLNGLDTEAAKLKISRSEVVNRILLAHFDPKPPQVNQNDFKAMQATVEQISEVVNKLLSERLSMPSAPVKQVPQNGVQMPLFDLPPDDDWMKMPPRVFGQALADKLESSPVLKSQKNWIQTPRLF